MKLLTRGQRLFCEVLLLLLFKITSIFLYSVAINLGIVNFDVVSICVLNIIYDVIHSYNNDCQIV